MKQNKRVLKTIYKQYIIQVSEGKEKKNIIGKKQKRIENVDMDQVEILYWSS